MLGFFQAFLLEVFLVLGKAVGGAEFFYRFRRGVLEFYGFLNCITAGGGGGGGWGGMQGGVAVGAGALWGIYLIS